MVMSAAKMDKWGTRFLIVGILGSLVLIIGFFIYVMATDSGTEVLSYDFEVVREEALVTVRDGGSIDIDYTFEFINYGDLDGVDVGLPNRHYDADTAWAYVEVDGRRYEPREIRKSPYVSVGLAVEFTTECRKAAESGDPRVTVRFHVNNPQMVYENELKEGTAGVRFRPTWFGSDYQRGPTDTLVVRIMGPKGHNDPNTTYYIEEMAPHSAYVTTEGRLMASWEFHGVEPADQRVGDYDVGMAFPKSAVDTIQQTSGTDRLGDILYSIGHACWVAWPIILFAIFFGLFFVGLGIQDRARRRSYFDPDLTVQGAGPRRDLTAVEAAVVMELPFDRVAAMVLFGMQRKGLVEVDYGADPITIKKVEEVGDHLYETRFLSAVRSEGQISRKFLRAAMIKLVEETQAKMEGFGLEATRTYYSAICAKAWTQVTATGSEKAFKDLLDEKNEWLLLDEDYDDRMSGLYVHTGSLSGADVGGRIDVRGIAGDYVGRLRNASSRMVDDIKTLTKDVTEVTNPPPAGGGGGFGGGGCACACACACAGGGR